MVDNVSFAVSTIKWFIQSLVDYDKVSSKKKIEIMNDE